MTSLAQGPHGFAVRATDAAGHDDPSPASRAWTVDTVPPDVAITAGPGNGATSGPRVAFGFTASDGTVVCGLDAAPLAACTSPVAVNLPAGPHQFTVRATDAASNVTTVIRSWTVVCSPPDATGAAALLHLDDTGQTLANAVAGRRRRPRSATPPRSSPAIRPRWRRPGSAAAWRSPRPRAITWRGRSRWPRCPS